MATTPALTHYELLGLPTDAEPEQIKAAYRRLLRTHHPDIAGPHGAAMTSKLNDAYAELSNADRRASYDRSLRQPDPEPAPPPRQEYAPTSTGYYEPAGATYYPEDEEPLPAEARWSPVRQRVAFALT